MKSAVIDKTLSYFPYNSGNTCEEKLLEYCSAVMACGVDYMEIDGNVATMLENQDLSENYILRVQNVSDLKLCMRRRFAYVVVPYKLAAPFFKIGGAQQIIVEASVDEYSAQAMLLYLMETIDTRRISMIRLTGIFGGEQVEELVKWHKENSYIPLDICPLNTMMTGVSDAISAYTSGADAVTLSFGRGYYYTALEQFLINVHIFKKTYMQEEVIKGICGASLLFSEIFGAIPCGIEQIFESEEDICASVHDIESGISYRPFKAAQKSRYTPKESVIEKKIRSIGLEREIEDTILELIKKVDICFYSGKIKRNFID